ncbi:lysyl oxidase-like protein 2/3/4 [Sarotherodon galilaeus]
MTKNVFTNHLWLHFCMYAGSLKITFAAHIIVQFTQRLLDKELPSLCESDMPHSLCGAFILVCREMYNTCEGLQVLRPYGLHKALAAVWKKAHLEGDIIGQSVEFWCHSKRPSAAPADRSH